MRKEIRFYREVSRTDRDDRVDRADENRDPISGARGAHPVGVGVGAAVGGAATGAAVGSVAGPIGTAVGMAAGAIVGGLAGKGVAEKVNPTVEADYWRTQYRNEPYYQQDRGFEDYEGAYRTGYEGYSRYGDRTWDEVKADLQRDYETNRGGSGLEWNDASRATRAAWDRVDMQLRQARSGKGDVNSPKSGMDRGESVTTNSKDMPNRV